MTTDMELVREYARNNSEEAFAVLVSRHINLVYSVALRQVRNSHLAEEITQAVFIILARKADSLGPKTILSGWLCRTARYASANALTIQRRRQRREQEAFMQSKFESGTGILPVSEAEAETWNEISPLLDAAMEKLGQKDHDALALRFFENKNFAEVGAALGASEDAAKKRVSRALEKLRKFFAKRGVVSATTILAGAISANSVHAAPVGLTKTISTVAIAKSAAASASTLTLIKGALKIMAWTKMKTAIVASVVVLLAAGTTTVTIHQINKNSARDSWQGLEHFEGRAAILATLNKTPPQVTILPTIHSDYGGTWLPDGKGRSMGMDLSVTDLLENAYRERTTHMVFSEPTAGGKYDYIANLPNGSEVALQQKIKEQFGVVAHKEVVMANVWVLRVSDPEKINAIISKGGHADEASASGTWKVDNAKIADLADVLEGWVLLAPVIDRTGLHGKYDFSLSWDYPDKSKSISMITDELKQVGIELMQTNMPMAMLIVEKAN